MLRLLGGTKAAKPHHSCHFRIHPFGLCLLIRAGLLKEKSRQANIHKHRDVFGLALRFQSSFPKMCRPGFCPGTQRGGGTTSTGKEQDCKLRQERSDDWHRANSLTFFSFFRSLRPFFLSSSSSWRLSIRKSKSAVASAQHGVCQQIATAQRNQRMVEQLL